MFYNFSKIGINPIVAYCLPEEGKTDQTWTVLNFIREQIDKNINTFQKVDDKEVYNQNKFLYIHYNYSNRIISKIPLIIEFIDDYVIINDRKFKLEKSKEYTYKIMKTKIKAIDIKDFLIESMNSSDVFHGNFHSVLLRSLTK